MPQSAPPLRGLVLAGGRGTRLGGRDKGTLDYHGQPQVRWAYALLAALCPGTCVAVRPEQAEHRAYQGLPLLLDTPAAAGPAAGLLAAFSADTRSAWLVLAADLPLVDAALLERLIAARDPAALGTGYRQPDGTPEPLCAIFEPAARGALERQPPERLSLRRVLEEGPSRLVDAAEPARLRSVNDPADDAAVRRRLAEQAGGSSV